LTDIPDADHCRHWEICGLGQWGGEGYCILHSPKGKGGGDLNSEFHTVFRQLLESGHTNFQKVKFQHGNVIQDQECLEELDLTDTDFEDHGTLNFKRINLRKGLKLTSKTLGAINFEEDCTMGGAVTIIVESTKATGVTMGRNVKFHHDLTMRHSSAIQKFELGGNTVLDGKLSIHTKYLQGFSGSGARVSSALDLQDCNINGGLDLSKVKFLPQSEVNLNGSTLSPNGGLTIGDSSVPRILHINGLSAHKAVIASPSLHSPMQILAPTDPPRFDWEQEVRIKNCDLSECCLLGNNLEHFKLTNVQWLRWHPMKKLSRFGRDIIKDEFNMRNKSLCNTVEIRYLKESYQVLKEKYQEQGNQLQAGYFHYGEMEMRRHEQGWRHRFFSLDSFYWLFSGYGMGWGRALVMLLVGTFIASVIYWVGDISKSCHNWFYGESCHSWSYWLRHSIKVGTFQRLVLDSTSEFSQWIQALQAIWSPIQIGLLGLAIRMRVRR
jgi:uncharacterized protein YjbI with pentapeptide repeats